MKKYFIILFIPLMILVSCMKDTSAYLSQEKREVVVDKVTPDNPGGTTVEGALTPGINLVKLKVMYNGVESERRFKYFMPISIDKTKPISLIFNFHGSYGAGVDPIERISMGDPLNQLAIKENCIIVFPAGEDTGNAVNWQNSTYHLPFVDSMIVYFKKHTPAVDNNRIYTCGHSSGAIFSYVLAFYRSDVFAAAAPVSGQMKIAPGEVIPTRAVPIRAFNGVSDDIVIHSAALSNITAWAISVGGYFASDAKLSDTLSIDNYKKYLTKKWGGGKADIELFSVIDEGHGVNWYYILPLMWDFMKTHPLGTVSVALFVSSEYKLIEAMCGQSFNIGIKHTEGATISILSAPAEWNVKYENNILSLTAPSDYFSPNTLNRKGNIVVQASLDGTNTTITIPYTLKAPKAYYEVGDLEYDENFQPAGIVCWVNPANVKEAKIIALDMVTRKFGPVGSTFFTPDMNDGYGNTLTLVNRVKSAGLNLTSATSAFMYAYEYKSTPGNTDGWYLPAFNELQSFDQNLLTINDAIKAAGGVPIETVSATSSYYMSSTCINGGTASAPNKKFYTFDYNVKVTYHGLYVLANKADDSAYVPTRPVKKVQK